MRPASYGTLLAALIAAASPSLAQDGPSIILFTNVNAFDGVAEALIENANVVVTDNMITAVSREPLSVAGGRVIDGARRTMIPGLIDVHWHTSYCCAAQSTVLTGDILEIAIRGAMGAEKRSCAGSQRCATWAAIPLPRKR